MSFPGFRQREIAKWFRNLDRRNLGLAGAGAGVLLVGFVLGALFGEPILDRGVPVKVSDVPEINQLLRKVSRHIITNASENPTVATVNDPTLLKQQNPQFYRDVRDGDRLIIYSDRAILFSPERDLVLSSIVFPPGQGEVAPPSPQSLKFEIRNGVGTPGATKWLADRLTENSIPVLGVADAARTYPETLVIPLTDAAKASGVEGLLPLTGGKVGELPAGEKASEADILVILGTDQG